MMEKKSIELIISGRVQGVGYRYFTVMKAVEFNISGYVMNISKGRVKVVAKGYPADLDKFIDLLRKGPSLARVLEIQINPISDISYEIFHIEY
jgi:acylphosphatase